MKKIDTILFDLDGTLLDTSGDLKNAVNYALKNFGYEERNEKDIKSFLGNGIKNLVRQSLPEKAENLEEVLLEFKNYYEKNIDIETYPYEGILDTLEIFKKSQYKIAIISNKFDAGVKKLSKSFNLDRFMNVIIGERDDIRRKPAPDMVNYILKSLESSPENSIYIGDSEVDIETAHNSNIKCILVSWGFRDITLLPHEKADYIANSPIEIYDIVEKINSDMKNERI